MTVRGLTKLEKGIRDAKDHYRKSLDTAIRTEGFRLKDKLRREIREGAPGGERFHLLSFIQQHIKSRKKPLLTLAFWLQVEYNKSHPSEVRIGYTSKVPATHKAIVQEQQKGYVRPVTPAVRRYFARYGTALSMRGRWVKTRGRSGATVFHSNAKAKFFFLRKETTELRIRARPIIEPFWKAHSAEAFKNIRANTLEKMKGRRI